jgi:hypothetical protein
MIIVFLLEKRMDGSEEGMEPELVGTELPAIIAGADHLHPGNFAGGLDPGTHRRFNRF